MSLDKNITLWYIIGNYQRSIDSLLVVADKRVSVTNNQ